MSEPNRVLPELETVLQQCVPDGWACKTRRAESFAAILITLRGNGQAYVIRLTEERIEDDPLDWMTWVAQRVKAIVRRSCNAACERCGHFVEPGEVAYGPGFFCSQGCRGDVKGALPNGIIGPAPKIEGKWVDNETMDGASLFEPSCVPKEGETFSNVSPTRLWTRVKPHWWDDSLVSPIQGRTDDPVKNRLILIAREFRKGGGFLSATEAANRVDREADCHAAVARVLSAGAKFRAAGDRKAERESTWTFKSGYKYYFRATA